MAYEIPLKDLDRASKLRIEDSTRDQLFIIRTQESKTLNDTSRLLFRWCDFFRSDRPCGWLRMHLSPRSNLLYIYPTTLEASLADCDWLLDTTNNSASNLPSKNPTHSSQLQPEMQSAAGNDSYLDMTNLASTLLLRECTDQIQQTESKVQEIENNIRKLEDEIEFVSCFSTFEARRKFPII